MPAATGLNAPRSMSRIQSGLHSLQLYLAAIIISGTLWSIAFLMFSVMFWPILLRPRIDGRSG
jgi:uncharacterized protein involved in response to NO